MEDQSNEALWYVVHTYSGYENKYGLHTSLSLTYNHLSHEL